MSAYIPRTSDIVLTSICNRELIERYGNVSIDQEKHYAHSQEPVYGLRAPARPISFGESAVMGAMVDEAFRYQPSRPIE